MPKGNLNNNIGVLGNVQNKTDSIMKLVLITDVF